MQAESVNRFVMCSASRIRARNYSWILKDPLTLSFRMKMVTFFYDIRQQHDGTDSLTKEIMRVINQIAVDF